MIKLFVKNENIFWIELAPLLLIYAIAETHPIASRIEEVERMLADQQLMFEDEKIKMKSTIEQQTKLIDFLQAKTDNSKKKKVS